MGKCSTVAAVDLTFSAPKSMSVLFAVGDEALSSALLDAHERAVDAALAYLEREACWTRRGHGGAERLRGEGFIAVSYRHRMSRAGRPAAAYACRGGEHDPGATTAEAAGGALSSSKDRLSAWPLRQPGRPTAIRIWGPPPRTTGSGQRHRSWIRWRSHTAAPSAALPWRTR
jgi:TrwC relaxase